LPAGIQLPAHRGQQRIAAKLVVIVGILVAQAQTHGPLGDQIFHTVLQVTRVSSIDKTLGESLDEPIGYLHFTKHQGTAIRGDGSAVEGRNDFLGTKPLKVELFRITLCLHSGPFSFGITCL
jgi:hypothetical protein